MYPLLATLALLTVASGAHIAMRGTGRHRAESSVGHFKRRLGQTLPGRFTRRPRWALIRRLHSIRDGLAQRRVGV